MVLKKNELREKEGEGVGVDSAAQIAARISAPTLVLASSLAVRSLTWASSSDLTLSTRFPEADSSTSCCSSCFSFFMSSVRRFLTSCFLFSSCGAKASVSAIFWRADLARTSHGGSLAYLPRVYEPAGN